MNYLESADKAKYKSGTTIVGLVGKDFVILGSDKKGTMGNVAYDLNTKKLYLLNSHIGIGLAGSLGDAQQVIRLIKAEISLYETERDKTMSTKAVATFMSNYLNANRYYPYFAGFIMGGYKDVPELYSTDVVGGFGKVTDFTSIGSGSEFAMGVLEQVFKPSITKDDAINLVADAIKAARKRDVFSGGEKIDIIVITKNNIEELSK